MCLVNVGKKRWTCLPGGSHDDVFSHSPSRPAVRWHGPCSGKWAWPAVLRSYRATLWGRCCGSATGKAWPCNVCINNIKCAPYVSRAGYIHGLGQAFWMALYALGILHKLPRLTDRRKKRNSSVPPLEALLQNAVWVSLKFQVTQITSLRNAKQF